MEIRSKIKIAIILLLVVVFLMIALYIINFFNSSLSKNSSDWGNFGSYIGCITSLLAFIGVLYSIEISSQHHEKDSEQNKFFNLLNLHRDKMYNVEYITNSEKMTIIKGPDAFKKYTDLANNAFKILVLTDIFNETIVCKPFEKFEILDNLYREDEDLFYAVTFIGKLIHFNQDIDYMHPSKDLFDELQSVILDINGDISRNISEIKKIDGTRILDRNNLEEVANGIEPYVEQKIWEWVQKMDFPRLVSMVMISAVFIYKGYGHITGHYFRNMYYVMDTIQGFNTKDNYKNMYRAQLSRYELALGLYNAMSKRSSSQMIELLINFDVFKDLFKNDVVFINILCQTMNENDQNKIIMKLLNKTKELYY